MRSSQNNIIMLKFNSGAHRTILSFLDMDTLRILIKSVACAYQVISMTNKILIYNFFALFKNEDKCLKQK